ncbi:MAG: hypothetical protein EPN17_18875 [Methylobacter sp.]|nr:MAG: hypothetical protein EPN17_18875 [Methylobacter sp.]
MNLSPQEITAQLLTLPEQEQQKVMDFVVSLQSELARKLSKNNKHKNKLTALETQQEISDKKDISPIYQAFEQAGLIGCIETDEQLSTTYKEKLDFSFKHGSTE